MTAAPMISENKINQPIVLADSCTSEEEKCYASLQRVKLTFFVTGGSSESVGAFAITILAYASVEALTTALGAVLVAQSVENSQVRALMDTLFIVQDPCHLQRARVTDEVFR